MRDILCTSCSAPAVQVQEHLYAEQVEALCRDITRCPSCGDTGRVEADDDGESVRVEFVVRAA